MFEDSLFASGVSPEGRRNARRTRWFALASVALQGLVLTGFIVVPLIWPESLPLVSVAPRITSLSLRKPEIKAEPKPLHVIASATDAALHTPSAQPVVEHSGGSLIPHGASTVSAAEGPSIYAGGTMSGGPSLGPGFGPGPGNAPTVVTATSAKPGPVNISRGVSAGLLLAPIVPIYPRIAITTHTEGTVVVTATIDTHGNIVGLQVVSGPALLRQAAADAIKVAHYKPYLLNGEPTDVITTISVVFRMNG